MEVRVLTDADKPGCEPILRGLPDWFGIERAIVDYVVEIKGLDCFGAWMEGELVGFLALRRHFEDAWEIAVMGVAGPWHRQGIGRALLAAAQAWLMRFGARWLAVKTLGPSTEYEPYAATRAFYQSTGFSPLEELHLVGENDPNLLLVKRLY